MRTPGGGAPRRTARRSIAGRAAASADAHSEEVKRHWLALPLEARLSALRFRDRALVERAYRIQQTLQNSELACYQQGIISQYNEAGQAVVSTGLRHFVFEWGAEDSKEGAGKCEKRATTTPLPDALSATRELVERGDFFPYLELRLGGFLQGGVPALRPQGMLATFELEPHTWTEYECQIFRLVELVLAQMWQDASGSLTTASVAALPGLDELAAEDLAALELELEEDAAATGGGRSGRKKAKRKAAVRTRKEAEAERRSARQTKELERSRDAATAAAEAAPAVGEEEAEEEAAEEEEEEEAELLEEELCAAAEALEAGEQPAVPKESGAPNAPAVPDVHEAPSASEEPDSAGAQDSQTSRALALNAHAVGNPQPQEPGLCELAPTTEAAAATSAPRNAASAASLCGLAIPRLGVSPGSASEFPGEGSAMSGKCSPSCGSTASVSTRCDSVAGSPLQHSRNPSLFSQASGSTRCDSTGWSPMQHSRNPSLLSQALTEEGEEQGSTVARLPEACVLRRATGRVIRLGLGRSSPAVPAVPPLRDGRTWVSNGLSGDASQWCLVRVAAAAPKDLAKAVPVAETVVRAWVKHTFLHVEDEPLSELGVGMAKGAAAPSRRSRSCGTLSDVYLGVAH